MSKWTLKTETTRRFCSETGKPLEWSFHYLYEGEKLVALLHDGDRHADRGRFIAATLNAASPYVEATDQPLDEDALTEALDAIGPGHKTLRDLLNFIELKYAAVTERYRENANDDAEADRADADRKAGVA